MLIVTVSVLLYFSGLRGVTLARPEPRSVPPSKQAGRIHATDTGEFPKVSKSPDGRYLTRFTDAGACYELRVVRSTSGRRNTRRHNSLNRTNKAVRLVLDPEGTAWIPGRPHSLVFGSSGVYDPNPRLAVWDGGAHIRVLAQGWTKDGTEGFCLDALSKDGRWVYFTHWVDSLYVAGSYRVSIHGGKAVRLKKLNPEFSE